MKTMRKKEKNANNQCFVIHGFSTLSKANATIYENDENNSRKAWIGALDTKV